jgi:hypothetical protein
MAKRNSRFIVLRDIQDHEIRGDLSFFELGVYSVIHFQTEFSSGVWIGSAARVHATAPRGSSLRDVQRAIEHLEELRFLRSFRVRGQRGNAPHLVHKYEPLMGALKGKRLNAFFSDDWRHPVYESCALSDALPDALSDTLRDTYSVFSTQKSVSSRKEKAPSSAAKPALHPFATIWNTNRGSLAEVKSFSRGRMLKCEARAKEITEDEFRDAVSIAASTPFCCGENDRGWRVDFDWLIENDRNLVKVREGRYATNGSNGNGKHRLDSKRTRPAGGHFGQPDEQWRVPIAVANNM